MQEAKTAAAILGLSPADLIFLGYPDGGLSDIFLKGWTSTPYRSGLTHATKVPYAESAAYGQPQTAANLLADVEQVMISFRPTIVAYPNFIDAHPDHQATGLFVTAALADLHMSPRCLEYLVHVKGWPRPLRYAPFVDAYAPPAAVMLGLHQEAVHLSPAEVTIKARAIRAHASELLPLATLIAFARRTEVFLAPAALGQYTDPVQVARFLFPATRVSDTELPVVQRLSATESNGALHVVLDLKQPLDHVEGLEAYLFPLSGGGRFGCAPKLHMVYREGSATAEVRDLTNPEATPVRVMVSHHGNEIGFTLGPDLTGPALRGFFLRVEKGPGAIDVVRSRTIWIGVAPSVP
jgi:LmbE family N-acetylglucosaminyl deacetylase